MKWLLLVSALTLVSGTVLACTEEEDRILELLRQELAKRIPDNLSQDQATQSVNREEQGMAILQEIMDNAKKSKTDGEIAK